MNRPSPQFRARLRFTFREHDASRRRWFLFDQSEHRRVPMQMDGVDSMYTVGMWHDGEAKFHKGDEAVVDCVVICPEVFLSVVKPGVRFELWDGGFFAEGEVTERFDDVWPTSPQAE